MERIGWTLTVMLCFGMFISVHTEIEWIQMYTWDIDSKCGKTAMKSYYTNYINSHDDRGDQDYSEATDCTYTIQAKANDDEHEDYQIRWEWIPYFDVSNVWVPDGETAPCYGTYVEFYDGPSTADELIAGPLCGTDMPEDLESTGGYLTIHFVASGVDPNDNTSWSVIDFRGMFTNFRYGDKNCSDDFPWDLEFNCGNGICLPAELACDKGIVDHCMNEADTLEEVTSLCDETDRPVEAWDPWPLIYAVLAVLGALMTFLLFWCLWRPGYLYWVLGCCRRWYCCGFCYDGCPFFHSLCCQGTGGPRGPCCTCGRRGGAPLVPVYGGPPGGAAPGRSALKYGGQFTDVNMMMAPGYLPRTKPVILKGGPAFQQLAPPPQAAPGGGGGGGGSGGPGEIRNLALYAGTGGHFREGR